MFKIKDTYKPELQTPEKMKLFGITQKVNRPNKKWKNVPSLKVLEEVLVQCNLVDNQYQQKV